MLFSQSHDFLKGLPGVISTDWVVFHIPYMAVRSNENAKSVLSLSWYSYSIPFYISFYEGFFEGNVNVPAGAASLAGGTFLPEPLAGGAVLSKFLAGGGTVLSEFLAGGGAILPGFLAGGGAILPGSLAGGAILPESLAGGAESSWSLPGNVRGCPGVTRRCA